MSDRQQHTPSSGNVFADLGLDDADGRLTKAKLAHQIATILEDRHLTQIQAAHILGIDQPKVSAISRGRLSGFSTDRLLHMLTRLDLDVTITISPKPANHDVARIEVLRDVKSLITTS